MNRKRLAAIKTQKQLKQYLRRHYEGSLETFTNELNRESDRLIRTNLMEALQLTDATQGLEQLLPGAFRGQLYRIWGRHAHLSGGYPEAKRWYEKAIDIFSAHRDADSKARVQKAMIDVLAYLGKYDDAAGIGRKALRYYRRIGADEEYAKVLTNLGNLYHRLDENKKALRYYNRAYEVFRTLNHEYALAVVQLNRGNIYSNLNHLYEAARLYRQAASIYRSLNMDLAAAQADYSLATIAFLNGRYSESLSAFEKVGKEFRRLGDRRCLALTKLDRSEVYLHLNLYSQAIDDGLSVANEFGALGMEYEQAKARYFAAAGYHAFGDESKVLTLARDALRMFERQQNRVWHVMCLFLLARVDCRRGKTKRGLQSFRKIAAYYRRHGNIRQYHDVRLAWLEALISSKNRNAASLLARGIYKARGELAGYQRFLLYLLTADLYRDSDDTGKAISFYRRAIKEADKLQTTIFPDEIRRFFWVDKLAAYNRLAALYMDKRQHVRAFEILEKGKVALNTSAGDDIPEEALRALPPDLEAEREQLKAYLRKAMIPSNSESRKMEAAARVRAFERRLWQIQRSTRETYQSDSWRGYLQGRSVGEIQRALKASETLVQYVCRAEACGAFVVTDTDFTFVPLETDFEEIRGLLARFYFLVNSVTGQGGEETILNELKARLAEKVWRLIESLVGDCRKLILVPDGILARLPFYILANEDNSLLYERYEPRIYMSSSMIANRSQAGPNGRSFDVPVAVAVSSADLPGAQREGAALAAHFRRTRVLTGEDATSEALFAELERPNGLVHIAAHATQSYENHLFSQILLADGPVYSYELLRRRIASELVVLSGCQTGDPGLYYTSDSISIAQSFLAAGARNVIASYWPVSDDVTCAFMDRFYHHLRREDIYPALRVTISEMRNETDRLRHWAAFFLACR